MKDKNKTLMLARGSKTGAYDADAPDQWKFDLRHAKGERRGMAWIQSTTIALGHESPFCVDEHGNALWIEHMALGCRWTEQTARNVLATFESQGRVRLDHKKKQIWYCADVPLAYTDLPDMPDLAQDPSADAPNEVETDDLEGRTKKKGFNSVQSYLPGYVVDYIQSLPTPQKKEKAKRFEASFEAFSSWKDAFIAEGMAALRSIADEIENTTWQGLGIPKKRLPKRRPETSQWVQANLFEDPNFVQSYAEFVQTGKSIPYKLEIKPFQFVQTDADSCVSFIGSTTTPTTTKTLTAAAAPESSAAANGHASPLPVPISQNHPPSRQAKEAGSIHTPEQPPACLPGWYSKLHEILEHASPPDVLTEPMFRRIASHLREELLPQFQTAVDAATTIRKWAGIESIAKQVAERGLVMAASANGSKEDPLLEKLKRSYTEEGGAWPN